jgi:putative membrane protein insertion efficiency factor
MSLLDRAHQLYKAAISPALHSLGLAGGGCRFQPTCSEYATLALAQHGPVRGLWLAAGRLLRCHPFARGGWDPVTGKAHVPLEVAAAGTIEMPHSTHEPL